MKTQHFKNLLVIYFLAIAAVFSCPFSTWQQANADDSDQSQEAFSPDELAAPEHGFKGKTRAALAESGELQDGSAAQLPTQIEEKKIDWNERLLAAIDFAKDNKYPKALPLFEEVSNYAKDPQTRDLALLWAAYIYEYKTQYHKAILRYAMLLQQTKVPIYKAYANMGLYFLKQRLSTKNFNFQWLPTRFLNKFLLLKASTSPESFKYYLFNLAPTLLTIGRMVIFTAFWLLCMFLARFDMAQREIFKYEQANFAWDFRDILVLYALFTIAQGIVLYPYHGSMFFMGDIEKGLFVESIIRMGMLAIMSLMFLKFKNVNLKQLFVGKMPRQGQINLLIRYFCYILIVTGLIGFFSRYEILGFHKISRVYGDSWKSIFTQRGLYKATLVLFMAPFAEEIFYRAIILTSLKKFFRPWLSVTLSAIIFSAVHLNSQAFWIIFTMAMVLGWAFIKTKGLLLPMTIHFLYNLFSLFEIIKFL